MIKYLLVLSQVFTLSVDVVRTEGVETIECELMNVDGALIVYAIPQRRFYAAIDCTQIFRDSFEDQ